jgi:hypothetical protein
MRKGTESFARASFHGMEEVRSSILLSSTKPQLDWGFRAPRCIPETPVFPPRPLAARSGRVRITNLTKGMLMGYSLLDSYSRNWRMRGNSDTTLATYLNSLRLFIPAPVNLGETVGSGN